MTCVRWCGGGTVGACAVLLICARVTADIFTSTAGLAALLDTQQGVMRSLDACIQHTLQLLHFLNSTLEEYKVYNKTSTQDVSKYISNPINAFSLVKRLSVGLEAIDKKKTRAIDKINHTLLYTKEYKYPKMKDLDGAVDALVRLQETYRLNVTDLVDGKLNGVQYSAPMSMDDCYQIGVILYEMDDFFYANQWLTQALNKWDPKTDPNYNVVAIMEHLDYCNFEMGNIDKALHWTNEILKLNPQHVRSKKNKSLFQKIIKKRKLLDKPTNIEFKNKRQYTNVNSETRELYEALCRGDYEPSPAVIKRTKCYYKYGKHQFLRLAPLKVEEKYLNPNLYVFHNVMSDAEIQVLQNLARPKMKRAGVKYNDIEDNEPDYRISHNAWLADEESGVVAAVSRRVRHMSDLDTGSAEMLQIANYGIGGHYEPHHDMATGDDDKMFSVQQGNRIATILFYMSDVEEGGGTAFLDAGLTLFPERGSAAYWRNLHPSGEPDLRTTHAACPVLLGSKWVANKWLHQVGQELLAPCNLQHQKQHDFIHLPKPVRKQI